MLGCDSRDDVGLRLRTGFAGQKLGAYSDRADQRGSPIQPRVKSTALLFLVNVVCILLASVLQSVGFGSDPRWRAFRRTAATLASLLVFAADADRVALASANTGVADVDIAIPRLKIGASVLPQSDVVGTNDVVTERANTNGRVIDATVVRIKR